MKTLVVVSHPYPEQSRTVLSLQAVAEGIPGVSVRNLESLYGGDLDGFDLATEQKASEQAERIVFLFPVHWFNLTPMLKAYMNAVWTPGWAFGTGGTALKGKEFLVAASTGATAHTYSAEGIVQATLGEVLTPLRASALYVGMKPLEPLGFFAARDPDAATLEVLKARFEAALLQPLVP